MVRDARLGQWRIAASVLSLLLIAPSLPALAAAQDEGTASEERTTPGVYSVGLADDDGSALYSVIAVGGPTDLADLTVTGEIPAGARFVEPVQTPEGTGISGTGTFVGEADGTVTWNLALLPAGEIVGPFTYRVAPPDSGADLPVAAPAALTWGDGAVEAEGPDGVLVPGAASGTITISAAGTDGLTAVGETGVLVEAPAGAVSAETTLTFTRLPIEELVLTTTEGELWWCTLWQLEAEPAAALAGPIRLVLPNRQTLTPGIPAEGFVLDATGGIPATVGPEAPTLTGTVTFLGEAVLTHLIAPGDVGEALSAAVIGFGVRKGDRARGKLSIESFAGDQGRLLRRLAGRPGGGDATARRTKKERCRILLNNMAGHADDYFDAIVDDREEDAADSLEAFELNKAVFDRLRCEDRLGL